MLRMSPRMAVLLLQLASALPLSAQPTGPVEQTVYAQPANTVAATGPFGTGDQSHALPPLPEWSDASQQTIEPAQQIKLATHEVPISQPVLADAASPRPDAPSKATDARRLSPRKPVRPSGAPPDQQESLLARFKVPRGSIPSTFAALAVVTGLLLLALWGFKRSLPSSMQLLPVEAASVLGRMPLTGKQFAHLIKLGDKLVLVSVTPTGVDTLTEVTDPDQVTRLVALCSSNAPHSAKRDFDQILQQLATEPTRPGFLGEDLIAATKRGGYGRA